MPHEVLGTQLDHIQVGIAEVLPVSEQRSEHAICVRGCEGEHERPVQEPAGLVEHAHGALCESRPNHVFDLSDGGQFGALTRLLELDFASEQAPEDLRDELIMRVGLSSENLFQDEQVMMRCYKIQTKQSQ